RYKEKPHLTFYCLKVASMKIAVKNTPWKALTGSPESDFLCFSLFMTVKGTSIPLLWNSIRENSSKYRHGLLF
ncbi:MAG: hypothetical protein UCJ19_07440, partial [Oscillospiraceae bacterium]|nr:hypothetical protein [Oscillospiraceae bacterium]